MPQQRTIEALERQVKALELRKAGVSYEDIAKALGWAHKSGAFMAVRRQIAMVRREPAEALITLEAERLDKLLMSVWKQAVNGNFGAVDRVLKIMERRAKLLGLDAPTKIAPTNPEGDEEFGADDRYLLGKLLSEPADSGTPNKTSTPDAEAAS